VLIMSFFNMARVSLGIRFERARLPSGGQRGNTVQVPPNL
jgi:hypothetical protein